MPKGLLLTLALTVVILTGLLTIGYNLFLSKAPPKSEIDTAVNQARLVYSQKKITGEDLSTGPCLSNALMPGWVVDIVHKPRLPIDDLPENQCSAYLEGRAQHFVELDINGNLVRAK